MTGKNLRPPTPPADLPFSKDVVTALTHLRCMTRHDLHMQVFGKAVSESTARRLLAVLADAGVIQRIEALGLSPYILGRAGLRVVERAKGLTSPWRQPPSPETAFSLLQRAALWTELKDQGFTVGATPQARLALRRHLVDAQKSAVAEAKTPGVAAERDATLRAIRAHPHLTPKAELRCPSCGWTSSQQTTTRTCPRCQAAVSWVVLDDPALCTCGQTFDVAHEASCAAHAEHGGFRLLPALPFDVASRQQDVLLILVDHPHKSIPSQLAALPLRILGQPRLKIVLRPSDDESLYDATTGRWLVRGPRLRYLHAFFSTDHIKGHFPYATTADVVPFAEHTQLRVTRNKQKDSAA